MPRGGNTENAVEKYLEKIEDLENQKTELISYQYEQWRMAIKKMPQLTKQEKSLLHKHFIKGYSWNKCVSKMNEQYKGWTINKVFSTYRRITKNI